MDFYGFLEFSKSFLGFLVFSRCTRTFWTFLGLLKFGGPPGVMGNKGTCHFY